MYPENTEGTAEVEQFRTVQVQCLYRCPSRCRPPDDEQEVLAPRKMLRPALTPGIKEWREASRLRIKKHEFWRIYGCCRLDMTMPIQVEYLLSRAHVGRCVHKRMVSTHGWQDADNTRNGSLRGHVRVAARREG